jgi:TRAP-type C4-dicarboxylate transport system permease small subunit
MQRLWGAVSAVNRWFAFLAAAMILVLMLVVVQDVVRRAVFGTPSLWALDTARILLTQIFFLAMAPALQSGHHVSVDLFAHLWPRALAGLMPRLAGLLCVAFGAVLLWFVGKSVVRDFADDALAQTVLPIPQKWIVAVGPVGCAQFLLTAVALALRPQPPKEY